MFASVRNVLTQAGATVARYETAHPHTTGRVRQTVGGLLVADGLVGLENPLDGRKTRPGLFGALFMIVFGAVFIAVPLFLGHLGPDTDTHTTGVVTQQYDHDTSDGHTCSLEATFTVGGQTYTADSTGSSSSMCDHYPGDRVRVDYLDADPRRAEVHDGTLGLVIVIFGGAGLLVALTGLVTVMVRSICLIVGARLWLSGSRLVKANPAGVDDAGIVAEVRRQFTTLLTTARGAGPRPQTVPVPPWATGLQRLLTPGAALADRLTGTTVGSAPGPAAGTDVAPAAPSSTAAPVAPAATATDHVNVAIRAGWYPTADGAFLRWHDGTGWTDQLRPIAP